MENSENINTEKKKSGKFKDFLRKVFVHNIWLKIFSILFAVVISLLVVGFGI